VAESNPLAAPAKSIRDAAKYLIAAFGAIGAVLVANLSLSALPDGGHPVLAALFVGIAVLALALLVGMVVSVLTPEEATLGKLAKLQERRPDAPVVQRLRADAELFQGQPADLRSLHDRYVAALDARAAAQQTYLGDPSADNETISRLADGRVQFLAEAVGQVLDVAVFYQLQERFSRIRRALMTALALVVVAASAGYAWAVAKPDARAADVAPASAGYFVGHLASFRAPATLHAGVADEPLCLVRYYDRAQARRDRHGDPGANWWTTCRFDATLDTVDEVRTRLALPRRWGDRDARVVAEVPAGTQIAYLSGRAAKQCEPSGRRCYAGGGMQVLFRDRDFERDWFVRRECVRAAEGARPHFAVCSG
jgi:hypothetical protein